MWTAIFLVCCVSSFFHRAAPTSTSFARMTMFINVTVLIERDGRMELLKDQKTFLFHARAIKFVLPICSNPS